MYRLRWICARAWDMFGMPGGILVGLAACLVMFVVFAVAPAQQRLDEAVQLANKSRSKTPQVVVESPAQAFLSRFPQPGEVSGELRALFEIANRQDVALDEVSYRNERIGNSGLERYHLDFSTEAPYPNIRRFLSQLLAEQPYISLDQISFSRDTTLDEVVRANVKLTLHLVRR